MENTSLKKLIDFFLFLYLFFISFFNFTPFYLISGIILVILVLVKILKEKKIILTKYFYYQLFFIFYNFIYVVFGITTDKNLTIRALQTVCLNLAINVAIMNSINNMEKIEKILSWFIPIAIFACLFIIIYTGGNGNNGRLAQGYVRLFSDTRYTSMEVASWAMYGGAISLFLYFKYKNKKYIIPFPLFWLVIVWAGSRKCMVLAFLLQALIYIFIKNKDDFKKIISSISKIAVILIIAVVLILKVDYLYNLVGYRFVGFLNGTESSAKSRKTMSEVAKEYIIREPIKGYGLDTYRTVDEAFGTWSENNYLELTFGGGIILTISYYFYLLCLLLKLYKNKDKDDITKLFVFILLLLIIFDTMTVSYMGRLESFLITISSIIVFLHKKNEKKEIKEV